MVLFCLCIPAGLLAQPHNGELFRQLMEQHFQESTAPFGKIGGEYPARYFPYVRPDTSSKAVLQIAPLSVEYERLPDGRFVRALGLNLLLREEKTQSFSYSYADTLSSVNLRRLIKQSPAPLRGDSPTTGAHWVRPIALIGLSVTGLVMLFFIRSG